MTIKTFKRYENKYLLQKSEYQALMALLPLYMDCDKHSKDGDGYPIYNIYYDTPSNEIIRHSLSKPYYKEKLRLRSYAIPTSSSDKVFLELKKKIGGIVSKRRATLMLEEATAFVQTGHMPHSTSYLNRQVTQEIAQFLALHSVNPTTFICYNRTAFFGKEDKDFRLTFDSNITTRRNNVALEQGAFGELLLGENQYLMEVKISGAIPLWLSHLLAQLGIYSTSFSKYGTEYKKFCTQSNNKIWAVQYLPDCLPLGALAANY